MDLTIGCIIRVDGDGVEVLLTASQLNIEHCGKRYRVGQLGTYVTVTLDDAQLVGFVSGMSRADLKETKGGPLIVVQVQLVGTIKGDDFFRGVNEYPIIGDDVLMAVQEDFEKIFGTIDRLAGKGDRPRSFTLGRFAANTDFEVKVLGKEFFSKHVSILGNSVSSSRTASALRRASKVK